MSKYRFENNPIYIEGTDIPLNRLGITDTALLHEVEARLLQQAYEVFIGDLSGETIFDEAYFNELHRRTFEPLYDWAGKYRSLNMAKGRSRFCQAAFLQSEMSKFFERLLQDDLLKTGRDWPKDKFADRLAWYKCELIALHPFPECNGRITRLFFDLIAVYSGYDLIDYTAAAVGGKHNPYIEASIACVQAADCAKMRAIILSGLRKHVRR